LITEWAPSHNLVLNKFAINANHFILATKEWKEQTHLLEPDDLGATFECIKAYQDDGEDLFAFFNSGEHSGASQPHRHIQFLPVNSMLNGIRDDQKWVLLADRLLKEPKLGM
jgi:ATP adenylyltransferase